MELRLPVGPGTGIDTKWDKQMVLHIPIWLYRMLRTYAHSDRARKRRERAAGGDSQNQYLFLSVRGNPLYRSKEEARSFDATNVLRHAKVGQGVRQFITDYVIPHVRQQYSAKNFHYQFHDTRATFGMNLTDHQFDLIEQGKTTLKAVREFVKTRMGHASSATTDLYLQYRQNQTLVRRAGEEYESHLQRLSERAMAKLL
jgi:integrase